MRFADIEPVASSLLYRMVQDTLRGPHYAYLNTSSRRARIFGVRRRAGILQVRVAERTRMRWVPVRSHSMTINACTASEKTYLVC
jgi:hypothetical protein